MALLQLDLLTKWGGRDKTVLERSSSSVTPMCVKVQATCITQTFLKCTKDLHYLDFPPRCLPGRSLHLQYGTHHC